MLSRRRFLRKGAGLSVVATLPAGLSVGWPSPACGLPADRPLVLVILRGGLDALHAVPPYADGHYVDLRPTLAVGEPGSANGAHDLNGYFGLHPKLESVHRGYVNGEVIVAPASGTGYRRRSHFDGQNVLENGTTQAHGSDSGWLNRALGALPSDADRRLGLSIGGAVPLVLRGTHQVQSWGPSGLPDVGPDLLNRLDTLYQDAALLLRALRIGEQSKEMAPMGNAREERKRARRRHRLETMTQAAGQLLTHPSGPRLAVIESNGWDTHFGQNWRLDAKLAELDRGLSTLRATLEAAWSRTVVMVVSEFGRTARENGSRGTDHGFGGLAFLLGGAINGRKVLSDWPGLGPTALFERRDVQVTLDYRSLFKGVLHEHLSIDETYLDRTVFPGSRGVTALRGLVESA